MLSLQQVSLLYGLFSTWIGRSFSPHNFKCHLWFDKRPQHQNKIYINKKYVMLSIWFVLNLNVVAASSLHYCAKHLNDSSVCDS